MSYPKAVCLFYETPFGILAVSRRRDPSKFGLPGGKVDPGETAPQALIREVREETGLTVEVPTLLYTGICPGEVTYEVETYTSRRIFGTIKSEDGLKVRCVSRETLMAGPFGPYNEQLFSYVDALKAFMRWARELPND